MSGVCENERHLGELLRKPRAGGSARASAALALVSLLTIALLPTFAGCGEGRQFTAEEFVEKVNAEGVELKLGDELFSDDESQELYAVELEPVAELPGAGEGDAREHSGGSISVYDDTGSADEKVESCMATVDLLCFQASNVVVVLEGGGIEAQQLGIAIERLSEED
jgi:hypothetical protein